MGMFSRLSGKNRESLNRRYLTIQREMAESALASSPELDVQDEAQTVISKCGIRNKPREFSAYKDVAAYLLGTYRPSFAYFVAVDIDQQLREVLGYIPIGQIVLAVEHIDQFQKEFIVKTEELDKNPSLMAGITRSPERSQRAADFLTCALLNFGDIDTARKAYSVYTVTEMKERVVATLGKYDAEIVEYITG
jgi:hypothetical protein